MATIETGGLPRPNPGDREHVQKETEVTTRQRQTLRPGTEMHKPDSTTSLEELSSPHWYESKHKRIAVFVAGSLATATMAVVGSRAWSSESRPEYRRVVVPAVASQSPATNPNTGNLATMSPSAIPTSVPSPEQRIDTLALELAHLKDPGLPYIDTHANHDLSKKQFVDLWAANMKWALNTPRPEVGIQRISELIDPDAKYEGGTDNSEVQLQTWLGLRDTAGQTQQDTNHLYPFTIKYLRSADPADGLGDQLSAVALTTGGPDQNAANQLVRLTFISKQQENGHSRMELSGWESLDGSSTDAS